MEQTVYKKLVQRLDAIPNGFPPTESGVELRILEWMFTPEEAALAAEMRLRAESAEEIAPRAGQDPQAAYATLKAMVRKGLIYAKRVEGKLKFGLLVFVVGIYEEQLGRMDEELAQMFEDYYHEALGKALLDQPALHRVIPVEESIPVEIEIFPYERASELLSGARSFGVRDCICRTQQALLGNRCHYPMENCLLFASAEGAFAKDPITREITREEAFQVLRETEEAGLVHSSGNYRQGHNYICNCCTCCCGFMRGISELDIPTAVARSDFYSAVDEELCTGCEICLERCQFGALSLVDDVCQVDQQHCVGCGLCVSACPDEALRLERKPPAERTPLPADRKQWWVERAKNRQISLQDMF
jgi:Na+-translocating ferredoxin:NAD+ oxidoreductase RNF subunit RnfB